MESRHAYAIRGNFFPFMAQVRMCLIVIGSKMSSKSEVVFNFHNVASSFLQNDVYHLHQIKLLSVFVPKSEF